MVSALILHLKAALGRLAMLGAASRWAASPNALWLGRLAFRASLGAFGRPMLGLAAAIGVQLALTNLVIAFASLLIVAVGRGIVIADIG